MQLPKIGQTGIPGGFTPVGTRNSMLPVAEARVGQARRAQETRQAIGEAATESALWGGVAEVAQSTIQAVEKIHATFKARESRDQQDDFRLGYDENTADWVRSNAGILEYPAEDVSEEVRTKNNIPPTMVVIPRHMVEADMMRENQQQWVEVNAPNMMDADNQAFNVNWAMEKEQTTYLSNLKQSVINQPIYHKKKTMEKVNIFTARKEFGKAIVALENSQIPENEQDPIRRAIMNESQDYRLTTLEQQPLSDENGNIDPEIIVKLNREIKDLAAREPDTTGALEESQIRSHGNALRGRLNTAKNMVENKKEAGMDMLRYETGKMKDVVMSGDSYNTTRANTLTKRLLSTGKQADRARAFDLTFARRTADTMREINQGGVGGMEASLYGIENALKKPGISTADSYSLSQAKKALTKSMEEMGNDAVGFAKKHNWAPIAPFNMEKVTLFVANRDMSANVIESKSGVSGQFMDDDEYGRLSSHIQSLGGKAKSKFLGEVFAGFQGDMSKMASFFEPMKKLGMDVSFSVAGQKFAMGDKVTARLIVAGADYMKTNPEIVAGIKPELDQLLNSDVGAAYQYNMIEQGAVKETVLAVYAQLSLEAGETTPVGGKPNTERMQLALDKVTGGMIDFQGSKFGAPAPGMNNQKVDTFVNDLTGEYLVGLHQNYNQNETMARIQNGEIRLVAVGHNRFNLQIVASNEIVPNMFKDPMVFSFHEPDVTKSGLALLSDQEADAVRHAAQIAAMEKYRAGAGVSGEVSNKGLGLDILKPIGDYVVDKIKKAGEASDRFIRSQNPSPPAEVTKRKFKESVEYLKDAESLWRERGMVK